MPHTVHRRGYLYLTLFTEEGTYNLTLFTEEVHRRGHLYLTVYIEGGIYISNCLHCLQKMVTISQSAHRDTFNSPSIQGSVL